MSASIFSGLWDVRRQRDHFGGHESVDLAIGRHTPGNASKNDVAVGDDAGQALVVDDQQCAHPLAGTPEPQPALDAHRRDAAAGSAGGDL
jgi:hypothetical protein